MILTLQQGSQEWLDTRKKYLCASEIVELDNAKNKEKAFEKLYKLKNNLIEKLNPVLNFL